MTRKTTERQRIEAELVEAGTALHRIGLLTDEQHRKITARSIDLDEVPKIKPPRGAEIVAMRERANMSQAVFARFLNVAVTTLSQWEREEKRPRGPAAKLLAIVQKKGIEAIM